MARLDEALAILLGIVGRDSGERDLLRTIGVSRHFIVQHCRGSFPFFPFFPIYQLHAETYFSVTR